MGGNNPAPKIVAIACWLCHDAIDNRGGRIEYVPDDRGQVLRGVARFGTLLFERVVGA